MYYFTFGSGHKIVNFYDKLNNNLIDLETNNKTSLYKGYISVEEENYEKQDIYL